MGSKTFRNYFVYSSWKYDINHIRFLDPCLLFLYLRFILIFADELPFDESLLTHNETERYSSCSLFMEKSQIKIALFTKEKTCSIIFPTQDMLKLPSYFGGTGFGLCDKHKTNKKQNKKRFFFGGCNWRWSAHMQPLSAWHVSTSEDPPPPCSSLWTYHFSWPTFTRIHCIKLNNFGCRWAMNSDTNGLLCKNETNIGISQKVHYKKTFK